jgi:hypothetical protein
MTELHQNYTDTTPFENNMTASRKIRHSGKFLVR